LRPAEQEFSAGGVVVHGDACVVVVPARRAAGGGRVLTLPKGHLAPGESAADAALREVREEAGVEADLVEKLGDVRYWYQRSGRRIAKVVAFFLLNYVAGEPADHDDEIEEASWMPLDAAAEKLTYPGERAMVQAALLRMQSKG
jgi:8-oxo-dGTP pyrophosphatase MutT (NUDIX family)